MNENDRTDEQPRGISRRDAIKRGAIGAAAGLALPALVTQAAGASPSRATRPRTARRYAGGSPATVRFWSWYTEQENQFPQVIADFEEAHPNINVELRVISDVEGGYLPALLAAAAAGDLPEIYAPHVHSVEFGRQGLAADLLAELGAEFMADFFDSANEMFRLDGQQFAIGWMAQTMGVYYDPDAFAEAGIDGEPETWDDLIAASNALKENGGLGIMQAADNGFSVNDTWFPMITGFSDDVDTIRQLDERDGATWTDEPVVAALELYQRTIEEGCWQDNMTGMNQQACLNALYAGAGAGFYSGSWHPGALYSDAPPELMDRLRVMKTPAVESGGRHWTGNSAGAAFSVADKSPHKDAALTFIEYLYSSDVYSWVMSDSIALPATRSAAEDVTDPIIQTMASWLPDGCRHWLTGPAGQIVADTAMELTAGNVDATTAAETMEAEAATLDYGS